MRLTRFARSFIVAASTLCSVCSPCSAGADDPPDYSQDLADLQTVLELINQQLGNLYNPLGPPVAQQQFDGRMDFLFNVLAYGQSVSPDRNILVDLEKLINKPTDTLAGNPWWATNSAFALVRSKYSSAFPDDGRNVTGLYSFPQFLSKWSSFLSYPISGTSSSADTVAANWHKYFGHLSDRTGRPLSFDQDNPYTWFHFMADSMRSNWVLQASLAGTTDGPSNAVPDVASAVDDGSTTGTNGVPEMVVDQMDVTGVEAGLELVDADAVGDMFPASFTGADPEFVVFSGGRYGAVTVPEVRGSLAIPDNVARYLRGVATWLWRVALFVGCFVILRQEVAFWSTLGGSTSDA